MNNNTNEEITKRKISKKLKTKLNETYLKKIRSECHKLSIEFSKLSNVFENFCSYLTIDKFQSLDEANEIKNNKEEISIPLEEEKIKEKEHKEPKRKRSKIRDKSFLNKKIRKTKRSLYGLVLTVNCIDENNSIIKGYSAHIVYKELSFLIGPYKNFDFSMAVKNSMLENLVSINCTKENYKQLISHCVNETSKELYLRYPPLIRFKPSR